MINLNKKFYYSDKIFLLEDLEKIARDLKESGKKIGLCTGSFDLFHPGHATHLASAKRLCDLLFVGVATDEFNKKTREIQGRPIFPDYARAYIMSQLKPVDFVFLEDGTIKHLEILKPDFFIKGPDYSQEDSPFMLEQKKLLATWGGKLLYTSDEKLSTTEIINYIKKL